MKHKLRSGRPVVLSESTQQRLGLYALAASAAGVSVLALAEPAEAKVVYTPTHVKLVLEKPVAIDLNHDGVTDFFLQKYPHYSFNGLPGARLLVCQFMGSGSAGQFCGGRGQGSNAVRVVASHSRWWADDLRSGAVIKTGDKFVGGGSWAEDLGAFGIETDRPLQPDRQFYPVWSGPWMNSGKGVKDRYLGLKFKIGSRFHYGWARMTVRTIIDGYNSNFTAVLTGYAYETVPGKPITAGETKGRGVASVPADSQAGTLGRLALGRK